MTNLNLDIALKYARMGWQIFPSIWKDNKHCPLISWGKESSSDPKEIKTWWARYGHTIYFCAALQASDLTVIDVDDKKGKKGSDILFDLEFEHSPLPQTLKVATPSGGFHYIFKGKCKNTVSKLGKGIDTPVMIPLPGTMIRGKGRYEVIVDHDVAPLPGWVLTLAGQAVEKKVREEVVNIELDIKENVEQAIKYLNEEAPISLEGDGGDLTAFQEACKVRDLGISETSCLQLMLEIWNERCEPPWSIEELQKKVSNAYQYAQESIGRSTPEADFTAIPLPEEATISQVSEDGPRLIHIKSFSGTPPKRRWLVEGVIPKGEVSVIYGAGGLGKSLLSIQLALNVAAGKGTFLGFDISGQMPSLIVPYEDNKDEIHRRIHGIKRAEEYEFLDLDKTPCWVCPMAGISGKLGVQVNNVVKYGVFLADLKKKIETVRGESKDVLLILDTLSDIFATNENDRNSAGYCVKTILGGLVKDHGCTILVVAHPSKSGVGDKTFSSGSTGWQNSFRNVLALGHHDNENLRKTHRMFYQIKTNYSAPFDPLTLKWSNGVYTVEDENTIIDTVYEKNVAKVLEVITEQCTKADPTPLGLHPLKKPSYRTLSIPNAAGGLLDDKLKDKIITELITDGLVKDVRGKSRSTRNGLWPVSLLKKEETKDEI